MSALEPSEAVVDRVAEFLRHAVGLRPEPSLRSRLRRCIRDEARGRGQDIDDYLVVLFRGGGPLQSLVSRATAQEIGFFRHPEHFEVLARDILPRLPAPVTIWSAGCANGEEAYSLAMLLEEEGIGGSVIATDVSAHALQRTSAARYSAREVTGLLPNRVARHAVPVGAGWEMNSSLRTRVSTLQHDLVDPLPEQVRSCQVVFCRNVLVYFSPQHAKTFLDRVARALPAAWLFLGPAETIWSVGDHYEALRVDDAYVYRTIAVAGDPAEVAARVASVGGHSPNRSATGKRVGAGSAGSPTRPLPARGDPSPEFETKPEDANDSSAIAILASAGQQALAADDHQGAVVIFSKWVYLAQDDALAHLHLALALEAAGDSPAAQRAFGASRRALNRAAPGTAEHTVDGYSASDLHKLLDAKQQGPIL